MFLYVCTPGPGRLSQSGRESNNGYVGCAAFFDINKTHVAESREKRRTGTESKPARRQDDRKAGTMREHFESAYVTNVAVAAHE